SIQISAPERKKHQPNAAALFLPSPRREGEEPDGSVRDRSHRRSLSAPASETSVSEEKTGTSGRRERARELTCGCSLRRSSGGCRACSALELAVARNALAPP